MDDETVNRYINTLTEQLIAATGEIAKLRASINALRFVLADALNRDHPEKALTLFRQIEQKFLGSDPTEKQRIEASEIIELWKKSGGQGEA
jgi:hypothetical protein